VVSNIGSSGEDGVRYRGASSSFNVDSFFDIDFSVDACGDSCPSLPPLQVCYSFHINCIVYLQQQPTLQ
jgi:hypothetical protein